jgi:hypothetical protein
MNSGFRFFQTRLRALLPKFVSKRNTANRIETAILAGVFGYYLGKNGLGRVRLSQVVEARLPTSPVRSMPEERMTSTPVK